MDNYFVRLLSQFHFDDGRPLQNVLANRTEAVERAQLEAVITQTNDGEYDVACANLKKMHFIYITEWRHSFLQKEALEYYLALYIRKGQRVAYVRANADQNEVYKRAVALRRLPKKVFRWLMLINHYDLRLYEYATALNARRLETLVHSGIIGADNLTESLLELQRLRTAPQYKPAFYQQVQEYRGVLQRHATAEQRSALAARNSTIDELYLNETTESDQLRRDFHEVYDGPPFDFYKRFYWATKNENYTLVDELREELSQFGF